MYRSCLLIGLLLLLTGCESIKGPRARRDEPPPADPRNLSIAEQEQRSRDRLAYPDTASEVGPRIDGGSTIPGMLGR